METAVGFSSLLKSLMTIIQVDMGAGRTVCGVATQGKANGSFIKSYRLSFSTDGTSWTAYKEQNVEKV